MSAPTIPPASPEEEQAKADAARDRVTNYLRAAHTARRQGQLDEQHHQLEDPALEDRFARLAIDHPDRCSGDPNWTPGGAKPRRIQRKRTKGWRKPEGAVDCTRGSGWGNAWKVGSTGWTVLPGGWIDKRPHEPLTRQQAVDSFINSETHDVEWLRLIRQKLAGRDLMCWCPIGEPCHADWLLEVANSPRPVEDFVDHSPKPESLLKLANGGGPRG